MAARCAIRGAAQATKTFNCALLPTCYRPECVSGKLIEWAEKQGVLLACIQLGMLQKNAYSER